MLMIMIDATLVFCGAMMGLAAFTVSRESRRGSWRAAAYFNLAAWIAFSTICFAISRLAG